MHTPIKQVLDLIMKIFLFSSYTQSVMTANHKTPRLSSPHYNKSQTKIILGSNNISVETQTLQYSADVKSMRDISLFSNSYRLQLENVQLKLTWGIEELIKDIELFIVIEVYLGKLLKNKCINKPRPPRIEWESQGMFFTAFAINLQSIFFLDDMIPFPTCELLPMA